MPPKVPILMYHRIDRPNRRSSVYGQYISPKLFERQMLLLRRMGFETVPLDALVGGWPRYRRPIAITFDDGFQNYHAAALPILKGLRMTSTVFLVSDLIGKTNVWNEVEGDVVEPLMGEMEVRAALAAGQTIGSHSRTHADLCQASPDQLREEVADSRRDLEARFGLPIKWFCYPYGRQNPAVVEAVRAAGYQGATSTLPGPNEPSTDPFLWRRTNIRRDTTMPIFWYKLVRALRLNR
ncbi:MAG: hypothetical protein HONBIEJF_01925 [Fimbriimonadaceae bacterium]|nr:hypothetical protein [Fimbriimonadaceae bacterium]